MTAPLPELSRPIRLDTLGEVPREIEVEATEAERAALVKRFGLIALDRLIARVRLQRENHGVIADGRIEAEVSQPCVATGEPVPAQIDEPFRLRFVPEEMIETAEETELSEEDCDTIPFDGALIDIGEAMAETLSLALDPFPRSPDADKALEKAGVLQEGEAGPFAALKALKEKLGKEKPGNEKPDKDKPGG